jgi:hypothetical protein
VIHVLNKRHYEPAVHELKKAQGLKGEYIEPERIFYVGRPSILGNPYHSRRSGYSIWTPNDSPHPDIPFPIEALPVDSRELAIQYFRADLHRAEVAHQKNTEGGVICFDAHGKMIGNRAAFVVRGMVWEKLLQIAKEISNEPNQDWGLMCWCSPLPCHGDVIKRALHYVLKKDYGIVL